MKPNPVKKALKEGRPQVGTWLSLGSVVGARYHRPGRACRG